MHVEILLLLLVYLISDALASGDVTVKVFGDGDASKDVFPVAFTDYDGDKRTDLIALTKNLSSFRIYFGHSKSPSLRFLPEFQCDIVLSRKSQKLPQITGVNVADFTGDGVNDILVSYKSADDQREPPDTFVSIFKGGLNKLTCELLLLNGTSTSTVENTRLILKGEPLIVDGNGDMIADLVGETATNKRKIWTFRHDEQPPIVTPFQCNGECPPIKTGGFVDIDGDFTPDLVLVTQLNPNVTTSLHQVHIYTTVITDRGQGKFKLRQTITIDFPIGQLGSALFLDLEQSGQDHSIILPFCPDKNCKTGDFALVDVKTGQVRQLNVPFRDNSGSTWSFLPPSFHPAYLQTINVRAGDYNLDGYPDLIVTLVKNTSSGTETKSILFKNVPCQRQGGGCSYPRTFEPNFALLNSYSDVLSTAFYDSNENGLLDIMGFRRTSNSSGQNSTYSIFVQENSPEYDAYFVRWIIITGLCDQNCPGYGVMLPGGTMKYSTMDANYKMQSSRASQVFRTGFPLDLPGSLMGIGPSANFIDTIVFGGTLGGGSTSNYSRNQIIPNSNLIAIPWRRDGSSGKIKWEMKQILRPKDGGIMATFHVLLLICFLNASLVVYLHMKERKKDRMERHNDPVSMSALTMT